MASMFEAVVDSGTTDTMLPRWLEAPFRRAFREHTARAGLGSPAGAGLNWTEGHVFEGSHLWGLGRSSSTLDEAGGVGAPAELGQLPTLILELSGGARFALPPSSYVRPQMRAASLNASACARVWLPGGLHFGSSVVLGASALLGHDVVFDVRGWRLGVAPADCCRGARSECAVPRAWRRAVPASSAALTQRGVVWQCGDSEESKSAAGQNEAGAAPEVDAEGDDDDAEYGIGGGSRGPNRMRVAFGVTLFVVAAVGVLAVALLRSRASGAMVGRQLPSALQAGPAGRAAEAELSEAWRAAVLRASSAGGSTTPGQLQGFI